MTDERRPAGAGQPRILSGEPRGIDVKLVVASLKLKAQELGRAGNTEAAEAILLEVLELQPNDAEALALQAIVDSEHGGHARAVRRALRAGRLTHWGSPAICENLALFIRRLSDAREWPRILRKRLPIRSQQEPSPGSGESPCRPYEVVVLCPGPATEAPRFDKVFGLQRGGTGRVLKLGTAGSAKDKVRETLQRTASDLLVFVNADDVPTERFTSLVASLDRSEACDWGFAQATLLDEHPSPGDSAYGRYRQLLERLPHLPCLDFALFEQADATGGVICIRRAALERIAGRMAELPFSVRAAAIHAALESSPAMIAAEVVARPACGFELDRAAAPPLLAMAFERLLAGPAAGTRSISGRLSVLGDERHAERMGICVRAGRRDLGRNGVRQGGRHAFDRQTSLPDATAGRSRSAQAASEVGVRPR